MFNFFKSEKPTLDQTRINMEQFVNLMLGGIEMLDSQYQSKVARENSIDFIKEFTNDYRDMHRKYPNDFPSKLRMFEWNSHFDSYYKMNMADIDQFEKDMLYGRRSSNIDDLHIIDQLNFNRSFYKNYKANNLKNPDEFPLKRTLKTWDRVYDMALEDFKKGRGKTNSNENNKK